MTLRQDGLRWLQEHYVPPDSSVRVSKYYSEDESWCKKPVWWFEFPKDTAEQGKSKYVHLLCQQVNAPGDFVHLRVPLDWLRANLAELHIRQNSQRPLVSIYVSAEPDSLYGEIRGTGKLDFSQFLQ